MLLLFLGLFLLYSMSNGTCNDSCNNGSFNFLHLQAFADYDFDHSGRVHQDVMHQILSEHTLKLNRDHFNQLWNKFEQNNDGTISYKEFLKYFMGTNVAMANQNNEILESNGETNGEQVTKYSIIFVSGIYSFHYL